MNIEYTYIEIKIRGEVTGGEGEDGGEAGGWERRKNSDEGR